MPTTSAQFLTARNTALTTYANAVDTLVTAMIDLAALDQVLASEQIRAKLTGTAGHAVPRGFGGDFLKLSTLLRHHDAKPNVTNDLPGQIRSAVATKIADWTGA
jgi:hypothetical protein